MRPAALLLGVAALGAGALFLGRGRRAAAAPPRGDEALAPLFDDFGPIVVTPGALNLPSVAPIEPPSLLERAGAVIAELVASVRAMTLPRGIRNNNPGNIRWLEQPGRRWRGMVADDGGGYAIFDSMENGVRALGRQLLKYRDRGLVTVESIISTWAPPVENVTSAYVEAVARALRVAPDERIDVGARLPELAAAIIRHENGADFTAYQSPQLARNYTNADLAAWVRA